MPDPERPGGQPLVEHVIGGHGELVPPGGRGHRPAGVQLSGIRNEQDPVGHLGCETRRREVITERLHRALRGVPCLIGSTTGTNSG
jgi:hypothetical protein